MVQCSSHFRWLLKLRVTTDFASMKFAFLHIAWWIFSCVPRRLYRCFLKGRSDKNRTPGNLRHDERGMGFMKSVPTYGLIDSKGIIWVGWPCCARGQIPQASYFINETLLQTVVQQHQSIKERFPTSTISSTRASSRLFRTKGSAYNQKHSARNLTTATWIRR